MFPSDSESRWLEEDEPDSTRVFSRPAPSDPHQTVTLKGDVRLLEVLGEGGMSLVRSAEQAGLERRVAVKMLPERDVNGVFATELMREALVTGMLEHPNIVPVYAGGYDHDGAPVMVMKQIEGTLWSDVLIEADWTLEEHIEILMTVCRAVHFAHTKGIVHRDIKPDNVMLGDLGEIYVLDWGLAVTTRDDLPDVVPSADAIETPAGTPAYWAPEMALGLSVDERTDVYLMGAVLCELITSLPPHAADSVHEAVMSAVSRDKRYFSDDTPSELAEICRRAMAHEPDERFDTIDEMRLALDEFLRHSASRRLAQVAEERMRRLMPLLAVDAPDTTLVHKLFTEARFAFKQALEEWDDNADARFGLQRLLEKMADFHIRREAYDAARALVEELAAPRATLDQRLLTLVSSIQKRNSEIDELRRFRADNDLRIAHETRRWMSFAIAMVLALTTLTVGAIFDFDLREAGYREAWIINGIVFIGMLAVHGRVSRVLRNEANRRFHRTIYGLIGAGQLIIAMSQIMGLPFATGMVLAFGGLAGTGFLVAVTFRKRFAVLGTCYLLGAIAFIIFPHHGFLVVAAVFLGALGTTEMMTSFCRNKKRAARERAALGAS